MSEMVEYNEAPKPPALTNSWPVGLAAECAINSMAVGQAIMDDDDLCKQFNLSLEQLDCIRANPAFRAEVRENLNQIKDKFATIRRKAKIGFEFYIDNLVPQLLDHPGTSADVKLKIVQYLGKVSGLDAADKVAEAELAKTQNSVSSVPSINITLTQAPTQPIPTVTLNAERVLN